MANRRMGLLAVFAKLLVLIALLPAAAPRSPATSSLAGAAPCSNAALSVTSRTANKTGQPSHTVLTFKAARDPPCAATKPRVPAPVKHKRSRASRSKRGHGRKPSGTGSPAPGNLSCYPGPYTRCPGASPAGSPLQRAPAAKQQYFNNTPVLLAPGKYSTLVIGVNDGYYLAGAYTFDSLVVNGFLTCGKPGGPPADISVTSTYIQVAGVFHCGKPNNPYPAKVTITMTSTGQDGQRHLMVTGRIMLVGMPRTPWTQIANTVPAGSTSFTTAQPVDWQPGERIVMASTSLKPEETEEAIIASVAPLGTGSMVTVTAPFVYAHWGTIQTYATPANVPSILDERAEVSLLARNIVLQGDDASESSGMGAFMTVVESGQGWFRDVMFYRGGQRGKLGRYPVHWHLTGNRMGNYIVNSVIYKSWNRCVSIHATNYVKVTGTTCHDHIGHGYMVEDGCEVGNVFRNNLGIRTRLPASAAEAVFGTDVSFLSTFWITNSLNHYIGNRGVASEGAAFWLMPPVNRPIQACSTDSDLANINANVLSMGRFQNNVAHSSPTALGIGFNLCEDTSKPYCGGVGYDPPDIPKIQGFVAYKISHPRFCVWIHVANKVEMDGCVLADNAISIVPLGSQVVTNSLFVGRSANNPPDRRTYTAGMGLYGGPMVFTNSHFAGFLNANAYCLAVIGSEQKIMGSYVRGLSFDPTIPRANRLDYGNQSSMANFNQVLLDEDGSLSGVPGTTLVAAPGGQNSSAGPGMRQDNDFYIPKGANCALDPTWRVWLCRGPMALGNLRLVNVRPDVNAGVGVPHTLDIIRSDGKQLAIPWTLFMWSFNVIPSKGLSYRVRVRDSNSLSVDNGMPRRLAVFFTDVGPGTTLQVTVEGLPRGSWTWATWDCRNKQIIQRYTQNVVRLNFTAKADGGRAAYTSVELGSNVKSAIASALLCPGSVAFCCP